MQCSKYSILGNGLVNSAFILKCGYVKVKRTQISCAVWYVYRKTVYVMTENELTEVAMDILRQVRYFPYLGKMHIFHFCNGYMGRHMT